MQNQQDAVYVAPSLDAWGAWTPQEAARRLTAAAFGWAVVGGWAIDLWLGEQARPHDDLEIAICRDDLAALMRLLNDVRACAATSGEMRALDDIQQLSAEVRQVWFYDPAAQQWRVGIMLDDCASPHWQFKHCRDIQLPRPEAVLNSASGIPYLNPVCVLLFKARHQRAKDNADFLRVWPHLSAPQRDWFRAALTLLAPDHPWIKI